MQQADEGSVGGGTPTVQRRTGPQGHATVDVEDLVIVFQRHSGADGPGIEGLRYSVRIGRTTRTGTTGADGKVTITLAAGATATLRIMGTEYRITRAAGLEAATDRAGAERRLRMLGYHVGAHPHAYELALLNFQADQFPDRDAARRLNGLLTSQTSAKLREIVGE